MVEGTPSEKKSAASFSMYVFLVKEKVILGLFELDSQEVMAIAFVFHLPAFLQLGGKVTIKRMIVVGGIENAQVINIDTEM